MACPLNLTRAVQGGEVRKRKTGGVKSSTLMPLATLEFPPKKLFGNRDERVVAERQNHLEKYLRSFFNAMLNSESSPLYVNQEGLTLSKHTVCEFSSFFKRGVFDYSSHGTS
ncbi:kinesin-like protein KIF16B [Sphaerodactylus townsendi]|uniref:kinesin-like protein KIF16B n=1 Tax=Sphaerodactylus townsendi TaxID=933632 RepID=UPI0020275B44|nr:kinesin-like protein KIF16B [Sphaerodactylus townsendi]